MNENFNVKGDFSLDSFKVLLTGAYMNIMDSDSDLSRIQDYLASDTSLMDEDMSKTQMINLFRAISNRQKNNIQLLTQLISISNRNEQIKLLLQELTKIKELSNKDDDVKKLSPEVQGAIMGLKKLMLEKIEENTSEES